MGKIICFLNTYSGALTVIVTAIYTFATVAILRANGKSAEAAKEQVAEMRRQYDENNRARIEVEVIYERRWTYGLRFVNNGPLTAQDVRIYIAQDFIDSIPEASFAANLAKQREKKCIIGVGQHYDIFIGTNKYRQCENKVPAHGTVEYRSNDIEYSTEFFIDMENYATFYSITSDQEEYYKQIKNQTAELKNINEALVNLVEAVKKRK